jgi:hypothetical protein
MSLRSIVLGVTSLLIIAPLSACSTVKVHEQVAPGVDFSAYKTFAQAPPPKTAGTSMPGYSEITGDHIQAAIAHALEAKGFTRASVQEADLVVSFAITGQPRQDIESEPGYGGFYGGLAAGNTYTVNYVRGTLTIDVFDAKTKKMIWHAYGQTDIYGSGDGKGAAKVDGAIDSILKNFPPEAADS